MIIENLGKKGTIIVTRKLCEIVYRKIKTSKTMDCEHFKYF
jgi:hypothetical protein